MLITDKITNSQPIGGLMTSPTYVYANQYTINPTASYWLDPTSAWFKDVPINSDADLEELTLRCKSACSFVERHCNRKFARQGYSAVYVVRQDGTTILDNPPITSIDRICYSNGGFLNLANATAYSPIYQTTLTSLKLAQVNAGIRSSQGFDYTTYPTLALLAGAINSYGNGWEATITAGNDPNGFPFTNYPTSDLVALQMATCHTAATVLQWIDYQSYLAPAIWPTREYFARDDFASGVLTWFFPRGLRLKLDYVGGFDPIPPAIIEVTSRLVLGSARKKSVTLGQYSYTLEDLDKLPNSDKQILSRYKDREV